MVSTLEIFWGYKDHPWWLSLNMLHQNASALCRGRSLPESTNAVRLYRDAKSHTKSSLNILSRLLFNFLLLKKTHLRKNETAFQSCFKFDQMKPFKFRYIRHIRHFVFWPSDHYSSIRKDRALKFFGGIKFLGVD
jgi:hypothetical protein